MKQSQNGAPACITALLAEDDEDLRAVMASSLEGQCRLLVAEDGNAALRILQHEPVDILITDFNMPGLNGGELAARLASFQRRRDASILITSGIGDELVLAVISSIPRVTFMPKPFSSADLLEWLGRAIHFQQVETYQPKLKAA